MGKELKISVRELSQATVVDLEGSINLENSAALRTALFKSVAATSRLAINMDQVRYIDSSGIATLLEALIKARDLRKDFLLFGLGASVHDVLKLTNLLGIFRIVDNEGDALASR